MGQHEQQLSVYLFGAFRVKLGGELLPPAAWPQRKTEALLKVLVAERGRVFTQDQLIDLLFAELDIDKAVKSLYNRISELRKALEPDLAHGNQSRYILRVGQGRYCFNPEAECWVDADTVTDHFKRAEQFQRLGRWSEAALHYREGLALCQSDFLADDPYEEWALEPRVAWRTRCQDALLNLADCHVQLRQYVRAVACCDRALQQQPANETAHRLKIMGLDALGRHQDAITAYAACQNALRQELDVDPTLETQTVYEDIVERATQTDAAVVQAAPATARAKTPDGNAIASFLTRMSLASMLALMLLVVSAAAVAGWWGINRFHDITEPSQPPSVAVLPFIQIGGPEDMSAFPVPLEDLADGAAMELTHALSQMPGLQVASSTSAFAFRQQALSSAQIGEQLNVSAVIQGSLRRTGNDLRVNLELINVETGLLLWSGLYDIQINVNAFAGIGEAVPAMVEAITDELQPALSESADDTLIERLKRFFSL